MTGLETCPLSGKFVKTDYMGAAKPLVNEITYYLNKLNKEQQKMVLGVVKSFATEEGTWWTDKEYIAEMDRRFAEVEGGKVKTLTLDELEAKARQSYKERKRRRK
jgi:putative addiction module component (TIGR02574 family)